jgi:hypothetical protein
MKKLLALVIVGLVGWYAYRHLIVSQEKRTCQTLAELCGDKSAVDRCVNDVADLGRMNKDAVAQIDSCVAGARSCVEASGCLVGAGLGAAESVFKDFLKGVGKTLPK